VSKPTRIGEIVPGLVAGLLLRCFEAEESLQIVVSDQRRERLSVSRDDEPLAAEPGAVEKIPEPLTSLIGRDFLAADRAVLASVCLGGHAYLWFLGTRGY
jgi:hypothetical protein